MARADARPILAVLAFTGAFVAFGVLAFVAVQLMDKDSQPSFTPVAIVADEGDDEILVVKGSTLDWANVYVQPSQAIRFQLDGAATRGSQLARPGESVLASEEPSPMEGGSSVDVCADGMAPAPNVTISLVHRRLGQPDELLQQLEFVLLKPCGA